MLGDFIVDHRDRILETAANLIRLRGEPAPSEEELEGLPIFLTQLSEPLLRGDGHGAEAGRNVRRTAERSGRLPGPTGIGTVELVNDYGAICEAIMAVAERERVRGIPPEEYKLLNDCLDEAIAEAIAHHPAPGAPAPQRTRRRSEEVQSDVLLREARDALSAVAIAFESLKRTGVPANGSRTGAIVDRNLRRLQALIERSLAGRDESTSVATRPRLSALLRRLWPVARGGQDRT